MLFLFFVLPLVALAQNSGGNSGESCFGSLTTITEDDLKDLTDSCRSIPGISVGSGAAVETIDLKGVTTINGDVLIKAWSLVSLKAPKLEYVAGSFILELDNIRTLDLSSFQGAQNGIRLEFDESPIATIDLPSLSESGSRIAGSSLATNYSFALTKSPHVQTLNTALSFSSAQDTFEVDGCSGLKKLNITGGSGGLKSAGPGWSQVLITETSLSSLPDALWASSSGRIKLYSNPNLGDVSIPIEKVVKEGSIDISGTGEGDLSFPDLKSVTGNLNILATEGNNIEMPNLSSVSGSITANQNTGLRKFEAPKLKTIGSFSVTANDELTSLSFPEVTTFTDLRIYDNPVLNEVDFATFFPKLTDVTGIISITGPITKVVIPPTTSGTGMRAQIIIINSTVEFDCGSFKSEVEANDAVTDASNIECVSGAKGTRPTATATDPGSTGDSKKSNTGAIAGGVVGGLVVVGLIIAGFFLWRRNNGKSGADAEEGAAGVGAGGAHEVSGESKENKLAEVEGEGSVFAEVDGVGNEVRSPVPPYVPRDTLPIPELDSHGGQKNFTAELQGSPVYDHGRAVELPSER